MDIVPIADLNDLTMQDYDVFLIGKCYYDIRATILASAAKSSNKIVGLDVFDDYYSQKEKSQFSALRSFISQKAGSLDFLLFSTPKIATVGQIIDPSAELHVLNDPSPFIDDFALITTLERKSEARKQQAPLCIAWFGNGDNPTFPVGLRDLQAFSGQLALFVSQPRGVTLEVLTNRRALAPQTLASLARLPVPYQIEEWNEEAESTLLARADVAFIPVNSQAFSTAKSLNRAVTALASGTQVLSAGYPLYAELDDFIYRDEAELLRDLSEGCLKLRPETVPALRNCFKRIADADSEAQKFVTFLQDIASRKASSAPKKRPLVVLLGSKTGSVVEPFARDLGALLVKTPITDSRLAHDISISWSLDGNTAVIVLAASVLPQLPAHTADRLLPMATLNLDNEIVIELPLTAPAPLGLTQLRQHSGPLLAAHEQTISLCRQIIRSIFDEAHIIVSDQSSLPWPTLARASEPAGTIAHE